MTTIEGQRPAEDAVVPLTFDTLGSPKTYCELNPGKTVDDYFGVLAKITITAAAELEVSVDTFHSMGSDEIAAKREEIRKRQGDTAEV